MVKDYKIAVIGLGYVGLPIAMEFAKKYRVTGFDIDKHRIEELRTGYDRTQEADRKELKKILAAENVLLPVAEESMVLEEEEITSSLQFSYDPIDLLDANIYIITVPTPIDAFKKPDLIPLLKASETVGKALNVGDIVIYESTVYPGCTEEDCVPILEEFSGLKFNMEFFCGYSPERINPGDKINTLTKIKKITSGSTPETASIVDDLYASIITAGTYKAPSIKVAEAAKAIENAQRDVNISFVNELALIFDLIGIDTQEVIEAASTKWNFLKYKPGLVGGHCIGVDPYYLAHKAESLGYHPEVILSGRRVNDNMGHFIVNKVIKLMIAKENKIKNARALVLGITFKENCPDIRNSKVIDIYHELHQYGLCVDIYDPWADPEKVRSEYGVRSSRELNGTSYDVVILAVSHKEFETIDLQQLCKSNGVVYDVKGFFRKDFVDARL
ncbi:nucleotide sugar dehydrogenase [Ilyomonas limi]|uniref:Nucleotide sugar dehydrogenase n=1 Tax=Ilyomonas limi TaxID=2575867 RepID=A0A4U3L8T3_9BACT|nr:nucleotide sugar dehydrogenase [Ilyomonas limi]TKK70326.1 nucleotide sugar dehydrogenase [Ilyomonas limi]